MLKKLLLIFVFTIPFLSNARNTNNYLSYEYISTDRYKVKLHIFRDCRGVGLPTTYDIKVVSDGSCFSDITMTLTRDSIINRAIKCPSGNACALPNQQSGAGYEELIYTGIMDLDSSQFSSIKSSNCCKIYFEFTGFFTRNTAVTTGISGSSFNDAFLDRCIGNNSSVNYNGTYAFQMFCNSTFEYNPMAIDPDGDSLVFSLTTPKTGRTTFATFNAPLSADIPITPICVTPIVTCAPALFSGIYVGFDFDPASNNMRLTPKDCNEVAIFVNTTKEYRKDTNGVYQLIGETHKEHQVWGNGNTNNNPPSLQMEDIYYACVGDSFIVNVASTDKAVTGGVTDTTILSWSHNISDLSITMDDSSAKNQSATIKWAPDSTYISNKPYLINFFTQESRCNTPKYASRATAIYVVDSLSINPILLDRKNGTLYLEANVSGGSSFLTNQITWLIANNRNFDSAFTRNNETDSATRLEPGKYYINLFIDNGSTCPKFYLDSITIDPYFRFNFTNAQSEYCKNNLTQIKPNILDADRPITYEWYLQGSPTIISTDSILERVISGSETYFLSAKDNSNVSYSLSFSATTLELPNLSTVKDPAAKCFAEGQFDLFANFPEGVDLDQTAKTTNFITFKTVNPRRSGMVKTGLGSPYWYYAQNFFDSSLNQDYIPNPNKDSVRVYATNFINGCTDSALIVVSINRNPKIELNQEVLCQNFGPINPNNSLLKLPANLSNGEYSWSIDSAPAGLTNSDIAAILKDIDPSPFKKEYAFYPFIPGSSPNAPFNSNRIGKYKLRFCYTDNTTNCQSCGFTYLEVIKSPELVLKPFTKVCYDDGIVELDSNSNISNGTWSLISFNNLRSGADFTEAQTRVTGNKLNLASSPTAGGNYFVLYSNTTQTCPVEDSANILVGSQPNLKLNTYADSLYLGEFIILQVTEGTNWNLRWENGNISPTRQIREFPLNAGVYNYVMTATNPATGCTHQDTAVITVFKSNRVGFKSLFEKGMQVYPNPAGNSVNLSSKNTLKSVELLNSMGQKILSHSNIDVFNYQLNLDNVPNGTYYLAISGELEVIYMKLSIIK